MQHSEVHGHIVFFLLFCSSGFSVCLIVVVVVFFIQT